jgi:Ran GTPase-activating protein (RanGAP) involved in mRNA processing and transport
MVSLQLHWNMIRLEGAEVLCNSLRHNKVLTNLDLSYNALGSKAAGVLGAALMENHVSV